VKSYQKQKQNGPGADRKKYLTKKVANPGQTRKGCEKGIQEFENGGILQNLGEKAGVEGKKDKAPGKGVPRRAGGGGDWVPTKKNYRKGGGKKSKTQGGTTLTRLLSQFGRRRGTTKNEGRTSGERRDDEKGS